MEDDLIFFFSDFPIERTEALNFAHSICVRDGTRELNNSLHGSEVVVSTIKFREKSVKMIVIGEVDLVTGKNNKCNERKTDEKLISLIL